MVSYPLVLVGAGPANLALLVYLGEALSLRLEKLCVVLEAEERAHWHPGLCSTDTTLQISMLKDLVSLRDPTSYFTFINFLKRRDLLSQYTHLDTFQPSRELYSQYLGWVSEHFGSVIHYGTRVKSVSRSIVDDERSFRVSAESNRFGEEIYVCQNVVVAIGREPYLPPELRIDDPRVFHSAEFFSRLKRDDYPEDGTYVVVGAGQSAGEAARFLLARSPRSRVHVVSSGYLFRQVDDNPFVNDLYSNAMARDFFSLSRAERQRRLGDLRNTNYGVVDCAVLKELYRIGFDRKVMGLPGLSLHSYSNVKSVVPMANGLHVTIRALDGEESATIDNVNAVVAATGYADGRLKSILEGISVADGATDTVETDEHFEVKLSEGKGLFVVNHSRAAHGPTEGTMTALAERAQRIGDHLQFNIRGLTELRSTRRVTT